MTGTRVLTALVLIPVVIAIVLFTPTRAVALATAVITILALREYFALGDAIGHRAYRLWTIFCALLLLAQYPGVVRPDVYVYAHLDSGSAPLPLLNAQSIYNLLPSGPWGERLAIFQSPGTVLFLFVLGLTTLTLWSRRKLVEALPAAGISASALLLVAFPLSFAVQLHGLHFLGPRLLLFALAITWAADTTAYFVGRAVGRHPLAPHISPKKTWEGSLGGLIGSLIVAYAFHSWLYLPLGHLLAMAVLGNVAGQMGDLLESAYKRSAGVKDSGGLLPGHGGVLDRIDALILCIPVIWYYLVLVNPAIQ
jgi:phosphatidate cytidylyltransferase